MLKMVLLPEPLGPMRPRISPGSTANDTLLTAVNPPKRLVRLATVSMSRWRRPSLGGVGRRRGQRQGRLPMLQALGPDDVGLVVDVLQDDREGAVVLPGHRLAFALVLHAEPEHGAALREIHLEGRLAERVGVDAAVLRDGGQQH